MRGTVGPYGPSGTGVSPGAGASRPSSDRAQRLVSIDALRGLLIAGMIIVNHPGSPDDVAPILLHAPWHGLTLIDLGFPGFLFIVGVAIALSVRRDPQRDVSRGRCSTGEAS